MAQENVPAYGLVQIKIKDPEVFNERYSQYVFPILAKAGVEMIAGSTTPARVISTGTGQPSFVSRAWRPRTLGTTRRSTNHSDRCAFMN